VGEGIWTIVRPPSTLGHADYSANWLLFVVFAGAALAVLEQRTPWNVARLGGRGGRLRCHRPKRHARGHARPGWQAQLFSPWLTWTRWRWWGRRFRLPFLALAIAAAAAALLPLSAGEKLRARVHWARQDPAGGARLLLWRDSLRMAAARWPAGYGPETFVAAFARHQSADLSRAYPDFYHESPHNIFLDALVSQGVAGPLLLLSLAASGFAAIMHPECAPESNRGRARGWARGDDRQRAIHLLHDAHRAGILRRHRDAGIPQRPCAPLPPLPVGRRWPRVAIAAPCAALLLFFGVRLWIADSLLAAVRRDLDAGRVGDAVNHYAAYRNWRWPGPGADLWYSRRLAQIAGSNAAQAVRAQAFQQAGVAAQRATQTTEAAFNAYYNLAAFYARGTISRAPNRACGPPFPPRPTGSRRIGCSPGFCRLRRG
jgi:hypothetical protein